MPSSVTLPVFSDEEILLYEKLNAMKDAISAKFLAGIGAADIAWPLTAEGNLNMSVYYITGGRQIWGYVNAANYATLADAITASSGGVVLVPPETTITTAGGETHEGSGAAVIGAGPSSVIQFTASPTAGYMLRATTGTGLLYSNLTLDGNATAGAGQNGLALQGVSDVTIDHVWFKNFSGSALKISAGCHGVLISDCFFTGGGAEHIYVTECDELCINNITSTTAGTIAIRLAAASVAANIIATINNVVISSCGTTGLSVLGANAPSGTSPVDFHGSNITVQSNTGGDSVILGTAAAALQRVVWVGGSIQGSAAGGMLVNASEGSITGVIINNPATYCIDLDISQYVRVDNCVLRSGTIGVDASATGAECHVTNNLIVGCTTLISLGGTGLVQYGNSGQVGAPPTSCWAITGSTQCLTNTLTYGASFTIPANTLHVGDMVTFEAYAEATGVASDAEFDLYLDTVVIGEMSLTGGNKGRHKINVLFTSSTTGWKWAESAEGTSVVGIGVGSVTGLNIAADTVFKVKFNTTALTNVSGWIRGSFARITKADI